MPSPISRRGCGETGRPGSSAGSRILAPGLCACAFRTVSPSRLLSVSRVLWLSTSSEWRASRSAAPRAASGEVGSVPTSPACWVAICSSSCRMRALSASACARGAAIWASFALGLLVYATYALATASATVLAS